MTDLRRIRRFVEKAGWVAAPAAVEFLAAGEYNENYLVTGPDGARSVFRINRGSQLNLSDQIGYEFRVLEAVYPSGVTPRPYRCDPRPAGIDGGVLLMQFLPGVPLEYPRDWPSAASVFARVHALPSEGAGLVEQPEPVLDIARESLGLITRFADHPLKEERKALLEYHDRVVSMGHDTAHLFAGEVLCIVNTEVNSHNFLIDGAEARLVDWEKAVRSLRYQDLGISSSRPPCGEVVRIQDEKLDSSSVTGIWPGPGVPLEARKTRILNGRPAARLSWCFMAYYECRTGSSERIPFVRFETTLRRFSGFWGAYERGAGDIGHHPRAS